MRGVIHENFFNADLYKKACPLLGYTRAKTEDFKSFDFAFAAKMGGYTTGITVCLILYRRH